MGLGIEHLVELRTWRAFDVDEHGRVLAGWDETGSTQLVELSPEGEVTPLTALPGACRGRYLPGERVVVVQHDDGGNERGQLSLLRLDPAPPLPAGLADLEPLVRDPRHVHRLLDVLPGRVAYATNRRNGTDFDVLIRNLFSGEEEPVYDRGGYVDEVAIAPDSHYLAVTVPGAPALSDRLLLVDTIPEIEDEQVLPVTEADEHARHDHLFWLPGDRGLVVTTDRGRDLLGVARYELADESWSWLVTSDQHELTGWLSPDGRLLLVETNDDGVARLSLHDADTGAKRHDVRLPGAGWVSFPLPEPIWSPDSRYVALTYSSPVTPGDVLLLDAHTGQVRTLTDSAAQLGGEPLVEPTAHRVPTPDGESVPCAVYAPVGTGDGALAGSAVVLVHGGPEGQSVRVFNPVIQGLVARGHTVVVPNVRGSVGYGKRWYSADDVRKRLDSVADLAAVHDWLPSIGVDPARAALWGGSYGGYMVLAGLAFQPERWAAGVDIVGISSLVTFLRNTADYRRAHREREYGSLQHDHDFLVDASPITHVDRMRAPLFVIHGANDPRVPLSEAEQITSALRDKGVECELRVYADEGHGLAKRANRLDAYPRALDFLARYLSTRP
ncbi:S9 family peptidase [Streptoalloteichus hindustanus]|uniref:Dipeptidyl aminopeptidase/acylaminoacyl peptidase n=1 Tax=Streptoalloteichus hindustanus TaxID=2017 RepID=A0A1M4VNH9_STRHI|nr:S9 family peptidase [Streptoalloteichus hindustanus]SHE70576.1 Dipeptidyl aminopeptidase/acylaminoacyl peptidase [Streptoalloteichus hindustanus]